MSDTLGTLCKELCESAGCSKGVSYFDYGTMPRTIWQHGDNPEHVKVVDHFVLATNSKAAYRAMIVDWLNLIHWYEREVAA